MVIDEIRINEPRLRLEPRAVRVERRRPRQGAGAGGRPRGPGQADHHQPHRHLERHRHDRRSRGAGAPRPAEAPRPPGSPGLVRLSAGRLRHRPRPCVVPRQRARARAQQPVRPGRREPGRRDRRTARHPDGGERALGARGGAVVPRHADPRSRAVVGEADAARVRRLRAGARRRAPAAGLRGHRAGPPRRAGHRAVDAQRRRHRSARRSSPTRWGRSAASAATRRSASWI